MHYFTIQTVKFTLGFAAFFFVFAYVSDNDYHEIVDNVKERVYNCDVLVAGWHPDVPVKVIEKCKQLRSKNGIVSPIKE